MDNALSPTVSNAQKPEDVDYTNANNRKDISADSLRDREERAVAALLTRFRNLVILASSPVEEGGNGDKEGPTDEEEAGNDGATKELAAAQAFQMEVESVALVSAAEDLLLLTRELKEMWLFGTLRGVAEGDQDQKMDADSKKVGEMLEDLLQKNVEGKIS